MRTSLADPVLTRRLNRFFEATPQSAPSEEALRGAVFDLVTGSKRLPEVVMALAPPRTRLELEKLHSND